MYLLVLVIQQFKSFCEISSQINDADNKGVIFRLQDQL